MRAFDPLLQGIGVVDIGCYYQKQPTELRQSGLVAADRILDPNPVFPECGAVQPHGSVAQSFDAGNVVYREIRLVPRLVNYLGWHWRRPYTNPICKRYNNKLGLHSRVAGARRVATAVKFYLSYLLSTCRNAAAFTMFMTILRDGARA